MSADAAPALQAALYGVLKAVLVDVSPPLAEVYDFAPEDAVFPYITLGEDTAVDDGCKTNTGQEHTVTLHVWDSVMAGAAGKMRAKGILAAVYDALHEKSFSITGHALVSCRLDFAGSVDRDADGQIWHGVVRYRIQTEPS